MTPLPDLPGVRLTAQLHTRRGEAVLLVPRQLVNAAFTGLALADITPFILVTTEDSTGREQTVALATMIGDPAHRIDHVIAPQIDTPETFLQTLLMILGIGTEAVAAAHGGDSGQGIWRTGGTGILELLGLSCSVRLQPPVAPRLGLGQPAPPPATRS